MEPEGLDWLMKRRLLLDVVGGISALYACTIVHGNLKMEKVLVVLASKDTDCPVIAQLSDFGFSLDISRQKEPRSLVGFTPLWAAPGLSPESLKLTDIYSLGFIIWSVAICGRNPFEEFQQQFVKGDYTGCQSGMLNFLKETNEILGFAISNVDNGTGDLLDDVFKCCMHLSHTLQLEPAQKKSALSVGWPTKGILSKKGRAHYVGHSVCTIGSLRYAQGAWNKEEVIIFLLFLLIQ
jgi:serine/threonine protein kinase